MFSRATRGRFSGGASLPLSVTLALLSVATVCPARAAGPVTLRGHVPLGAISQSQWTGRAAANEAVTFAIALPVRDEAGLDALLKRLYDPTDPLYGQYLTPEQFAERFAPTQADYDAVVSYAQSLGLTVSGTHSNRLLVEVTGAARAVEKGLGVGLQWFRSANGRSFRSPDADPTVPSAIASRVSGFVGLDTAYVRSPHLVEKVASANAQALFAPLTTGSGPSGGMSPSDIKTAYGLTSVSRTGSGQTLAVFELDGYTASDVTAYVKYFGLTSPTIQNVLVGGATGKAGSGASEVTLDIELQLALAPGVSKILVYEGPNTDAGVLAAYSRIATDNLAKQVSTSWGLYEQGSTYSFLSSENTIFKQMASQGQTIYAAAGDYGAYDSGSSRLKCVDDPASQPYVVAAGGTTLTTVKAGGAWKSETTWNDGSITKGAAGGGYSAYWPIPSYQSSVVTTASKGSTTMRNVPDISLNADPDTGYAIYYGGKWHVYGGTSCVSPLLAAFTALVNEERVANGKAVIGFPCQALYTLGASTTTRAACYHDIADGSTNLYYPAVTGYDDATGWGTMIGSGLFAALAAADSGTVSSGGSSGSEQLLLNPDFESGQVSWTATSGVITNSTQRAAHGGSWKAWLCGYGKSHTDTLYQAVTIPSTATTATLTFYLHIDTSETASKANDTMKLQICNSSGTVLSTLGAYTNLNAASGYTQKTFNLSSYKGQTIRVYFTATENSSKQTSFVLDDFSLIAK